MHQILDKRKAFMEGVLFGPLPLPLPPAAAAVVKAVFRTCTKKGPSMRLSSYMRIVANQGAGAPTGLMVGQNVWLR